MANFQAKSELNLIELSDRAQNVATFLKFWHL